MSKIKYPAVPLGPDDVTDFKKMRKVLDPIRERVLIFGRDNPRDLLRSMVTVQDLIDLGLVTRAQVSRLK